MSAKIRPVICDFSAGEIDRENDGRVDLDISSHGCIEMTNMLPTEIGMASKRGGFKYLCAALGAAKIVEWNISESINLIICFYDGYIKLMRLMSDGALVTMTALGSDGVTTSDLTISYLDGVTALVPSYSYSDAKYIEYAQSLREITLVCASKYPAFYMKYSNSSKDGMAITLSYGVYSYTGNIARNPSLVETSSVASSDISYDDLCDKFSNIDSDVDYIMDSSSYWVVGSGSSKVIHNVSKIRKTGSASSRCFSMSLPGNFYYPSLISNISFSNGVDSLIKTIGYDLAFSMGGVVHIGTLNGVDYYTVAASSKAFQLSASATYTELLNKLESISNLTQRDTFDISVGPRGSDVNNIAIPLRCGVATYRKPFNTLVITLTDTNGETLVVSGTDDKTLKGSFSLQSENISVSGGVTDASELLNYIIPWMDKNKTYKCSRDYRLNGHIVSIATRDDGSKSPALIVTYEDQSLPVRISKDSPGVFGQVGVILTPFYDGTEYPSAVCYHQGRLCLASGNVVYMSKTNDYSNFCYFDEVEYTTTSLKPASEWNDPLVPETETNTSFSQQIGDDSAIKLIFATDESEEVRWTASNGSLFIGTMTGEWVLPSGSNANKVSLSMIGRMGSSDNQARYLMGMLMFISRNNQSLHSYDLSNGAQENSNLMFYARHIAASGIVDFDYRQDPQSEAIVTLGNGTILVMRKGKLGVSWSRVTPAPGSTILSAAISCASDEDAIICLVKRGSSYTFERMVTTDDSVFPTATVNGRAHLDSYQVMTVTNHTVSIPRLANTDVKIHLNNLGVEIRGRTTLDQYGVATTFIVDGDQTNQVVSIPNLPAIVGLAFNSVLKPCRIDSAQTEGLVKGSGKIHIRVYESGPFSLKYDGNSIPVDPPMGGDGEVQYPYTGYIKIENPAGNDVDTNLDFESNDGVPLNVQLVIPDYSVGEVS